MYTLSSAADHSLLWFGIVGAAALAPARRPARSRPSSRPRWASSRALTNGPIKSTVPPRPRPSTELAEGPLPYGMRRPITSSFPSGHATAAFTAATILLATGGADPLWYALAAVVAGSRVYVRMHHASDVVVGALVGLALGHAVAPLLPAERRESPAGGCDRRPGVNIASQVPSAPVDAAGRCPPR